MNRSRTARTLAFNAEVMGWQNEIGSIAELAGRCAWAEAEKSGLGTTSIC
jgi:hypothetical protein